VYFRFNLLSGNEISRTSGDTSEPLPRYRLAIVVEVADHKHFGATHVSLIAKYMWITGEETDKLASSYITNQ